MNIIPFNDTTQLPDYLRSDTFAPATDLTQGVGQSFPVISIKGKVFHIVRGDERVMVTRPDSDDPAAAIDMVIVRANPALSKTYYDKGYVEGNDDKPVCYSNNGLTPAADATAPQSKTCAACPHNVFGSKVSDTGQKLKACPDFRRLAVASPAAPDDAFLLRVPAGSLKDLAQYAEGLARRGIPYQAVVTRIGFDFAVAHPALTFKPIGLVDAATAAKIKDAEGSSVVAQIVGVADVPPAAAPAAMHENESGAASAPAPAPAPAPETPAPLSTAKTSGKSPKTTAKPKASPALGAALAAAEVAPAMANVAVETAPAAQVVSGDLAQQLNDALAGINFDN